MVGYCYSLYFITHSNESRLKVCEKSRWHNFAVSGVTAMLAGFRQPAVCRPGNPACLLEWAFLEQAPVKRSRRNSVGCGIAMLVDSETGHRNRSGRFVPDRGSVEAYVLKALRSRYRDTAVVPFGPDVYETIAELRRLAPQMVFNLTEWLDGDRRLDYAIAALLEVLKLRYTGTGPLGLQLCRDKALSKQIVGQLGIAVPRYFISSGRLPGHLREWPSLLLVKPQFGDGSDAI